ncbi:sulfotransferase [Methylovulum sp.]|uniref:sulfotransferase n=1 Tax=Methylovulum sp. TaxID=1916980 RepID=UPI00260BD221|nr:sulfotransferase [Methylovulum sp.]MDD5123606.1 sulfotransferase [Methylovulum sp.]
MKGPDDKAPVFVGGVGGSGTRVVTDILMKMGFFMGDNLNNSNDYMELGKLLPRLRELIYIHGVKTNQEINGHIHDRLIEIEALIQSGMQNPHLYRGWGWKAPPNFFILEHLNDHFPDLRYIHVIRHGLDMAFSENQNQLKNWGFYFDIDADELSLPQASLRYWIEANKFAINLGQNFLQDRFYLLRFDKLCMEPQRVVAELAKFLGINDIDAAAIIKNIHKPDSLGGYKSRDISIFNKGDIEEVVSLGFSV